jgi:hypothetical protein
MDSKHKFLVVLTLVLIVALAAFAVAGCGGSTTTTTAAPTTTTAAATDTTMAATDTTAGSTDTSAAAGASGTLVVKGLVDNPITWAAADLQKMNPVTMTATHPKKGDAQYTGVKLTDLFKTLGVQSAATTLVTGSSDGYMSEIALADIAASADAMLAIGADGTLNMVMPGMTGKAWATDVVSWEFK